MLARRALAVLAGVALIVAAALTRDGPGDDADLNTSERRRRAAVTAVQRASPGELRRLADDDGGYQLSFDSRLEEAPTLVCATELGDACQEMTRFGFEVIEQPSWATQARLGDGARTEVDVWMAPEAVMESVATSDIGLESDAQVVAETRVAGVVRAGRGPAQECESSSAPLTCLAQAAQRLTMPDPATSVVGAAVLVAIAHEAGGTDPDDLAAAAGVLDEAQVTTAPVAELLAVGAPPGEVALGDDAVVAATYRPGDADVGDRPPVTVRWARTSDSLTVGVALEPEHPQVDRIRALLGSRAVSYTLDQAGLADPVAGYVDPEGPLAERPASSAPVTATDLEAARAAWRERR